MFSNASPGYFQVRYSSEPDPRQVTGHWTTLLNSLHNDPMVEQLMTTRIGRYLTSHPLMALMVMVFSAMAIVPVGFFLVFALVTITVAVVCFISLEVFLLSVGGVTLLFMLSGLALLSILVASIINACHFTTSSVLKFYYSLQATSDMEAEVRGKANGTETSRLVKEMQ